MRALGAVGLVLAAGCGAAPARAVVAHPTSDREWTRTAFPEHMGWRMVTHEVTLPAASDLAVELENAGSGDREVKLSLRPGTWRLALGWLPVQADGAPSIAWRVAARLKTAAREGASDDRYVRSGDFRADPDLRYAGARLETAASGSVITATYTFTDESAPK
jgi:hypothetical protein